MYCYSIEFTDNGRDYYRQPAISENLLTQSEEIRVCQEFKKRANKKITIFGIFMEEV